MKSRLPAVQAVLYLLFNEGYLSSHPEEAIRRELCDEAVRLTTFLAEHPVGAVRRGQELKIRGVGLPRSPTSHQLCVRRGRQ
jgi:hypothetical protein